MHAGSAAVVPSPVIQVHAPIGADSPGRCRSVRSDDASWLALARDRVRRASPSGRGYDLCLLDRNRDEHSDHLPLPAAQRDYRRMFTEAAWRIGSTRGRAGLTVRAIAEEVDVSSGLIYAHFEDKTALIAELHTLAARRLETALQYVLPHHDVHEELLALAVAYIGFVRAHSWLYENSRFDPPTRCELLPHRLVFVERVEPLIMQVSPSPSHHGAAGPAEHLWLGCHGFAQLGPPARVPEDDARAFVVVHARLLLLGVLDHSG